MNYNEIKELTRRFRKNPTPEEHLLWQLLRGRQLQKRKFLRQYPIIYESSASEHFFFIADFYCATEKLIVELDGPIHDFQNIRDV